MDCSPLGSSVHGISQARILDWVAISSSRGSLQPRGQPISPALSEVKASAWNAGNQGSIPGSGRSPGGGKGNPLQYSCPENSKDRGTWRATVHGLTGYSPWGCKDVKLLPLPKIVTWSNTNVLILMYKAKYSKLKYILAPR